MLKHYYNIAELISQYLSNTISEEDNEALTRWREESLEHEKLFQKICDTEHISQHTIESSRFNKTEGWDEVNKRIHLSVRKKFILNIVRYAAILLLPVLLVSIILTIDNTPDYVADIPQQPETFILPGEKKAILTLDNGEVIDLSDYQNKKVNEKDGTAISIDETTLNYQPPTEKEKKLKEEIYNTVNIPHGGEYSLSLSDGTKIHLNAMSTLRFPVHFTGDTRQVELIGEAYFEVAKDSKPFIVKMNDMRIEVLGTVFNISAYQDEDYLTTLVEGSVNIATNSGISQMLRPSEQAIFNTDSNKIKTEKVDVSLFTSWVNGRIHFKDQRLEDIMKTLSRWYDMEVVYKDPKLKDLRFGCNVDRYTEITPFLDLLEQTGKVKITQNGKTITIK